jgi:hypothetical protein
MSMKSRFELFLADRGDAYCVIQCLGFGFGKELQGLAGVVEDKILKVLVV